MVSGDEAMISIHSLIGLPYFFSIDGTYDTGPFGGMVTVLFSLVASRFGSSP